MAEDRAAQAPSGTPLRPWAVPLMVLLLGSALSGGLAWQQRRANDARIAAATAEQALRLAGRVQSQIERTVLGLRGARGFLLGRQLAQVRPQDFASYMRGRELASEFPGVLGFGYIARIAPQGQVALERHMRASGAPSFAISDYRPRRPGASTALAEREVVLWAEPAAELGRAVGWDVGTDPLRALTLQRADDPRRGVLSPPLELRESRLELPQTLLVVLPVSAAGLDDGALPIAARTPVGRSRLPGSAATGASGVAGWVFAPLRLSRLLEAVELDAQRVHLQLEDTTPMAAASKGPVAAAGPSAPTTGAAATAFRLPPPPPDTLVSAGLSARLEREVLGRRWRYTVSPRAALVHGLNLVAPWQVAGAGGAVTLLLAALVALRGELRRREQQLLVQHTRQARQARADLRAVLDAIPSMVGSWDAQLHNRFANQAYAHFFGRTPEQIAGMTLPELLGPRLMALNQAHIEAALAGQEQRFERDIPVPGGDGAVHHTLAHYLPQREAGRVTGFYVLVHDISEVKRAAQRMADILEATQAGTWEWNLQTGAALCNARWSALAGRSSEHEPVRTVEAARAQVHADDLPRLDAQLARHLDGQAAHYECELRVRHADGSWRWMQDRGRITARTPDGRALWLAGTRRDISDRKRQEEALRRSESMLARTGALARVGGWDIDLDSGRILWSDETCRIHGRLPGHQPSMDEALAYYPGPARQTITEAVERGMREGRSWDLVLPLVRADGRRIWVRAFGEPLRAAGARDAPVVRLVGAFQDVTDSHDAAQALAEARDEAERSRAVLRAALDTVDEAFVLFDPEGRLLLCNDRYRALHADLDDLLQPGVPREELRRAAAERGVQPLAGGRLDAWLVRQPDPWPEAPLIETLTVPDGRVLRVVERQLPDGHSGGFSFDITELVRAREAAEAASRAKSAFLTNTSHEIRTPLNAILGLAWRLERDALPAAALERVHSIAQAGRALLALLDDVLDLARIESGRQALERRTFDLHGLLRELVTLFGGSQPREGLRLRLGSLEDVPRWVRGDPLRLRQVLLNLLGNALKFTEAGEVALTVACVPAGLRLCVSDTGPGLAPELQARLFQPFEQGDASTTRRHGGSGLGLAISAQWVALMGGELRVDSVPGQGAAFSFTLDLPADERPDEPADESAPSPGRRLAGLRVLVTDDHALNLRVASDVLQHEGVEVLVACSGAQTLALVDAVQPPLDALLLDLQMPQMDGLAVARALRERPAGARLPIIALSAGVLPEQRAAALAAGMDDFLPKPLEPERLLACLRQRIGSGLRPGGARPDARESPPPKVLPAPGRSPSEEPTTPTPAEVAELLARLPLLEPDRVVAPLRDDPVTHLQLLWQLVEAQADLDRLPVADLPARLHRLRGGAAGLGAPGLVAWTAELEQRLLARAGDPQVAPAPADAAALSPALAADLARIVDGLARWRASIEGPVRALTRQRERALRIAVREALREAGPVAPAEGAEPGSPRWPAALDALHAACRGHAAQAGAQAEALSGVLGLWMGEAQALAFQRALEDFDFPRALALLEAPLQRGTVAPVEIDAAAAGSGA